MDTADFAAAWNRTRSGSSLSGASGNSKCRTTVSSRGSVTNVCLPATPAARSSVRSHSPAFSGCSKAFMPAGQDELEAPFDTHAVLAHISFQPTKLTLLPVDGDEIGHFFGLRLSDFRFAISDLRSQISDLRSQISDLRFQISDHCPLLIVYCVSFSPPSSMT